MRALQALQRIARGLGWRPSEQLAGDSGPDIVGSGPDGEVCVVVKSLSGANRVDALKGAAAMAVLDMHRTCAERGQVVWLEVDRIGPHAVRKLGEYLFEVAPDVGWAVVDLHGGARIVIPALGLDVSEYPDVAPPTSKSQTSLFSDLNCWMLKLLLMHSSPAWAWTATRESCRNAHELHDVAEVSAASAHRFVRAMTESDHLRRGGKRLHLVRVDSLLHRWRAVSQTQPATMVEARPLFEFDHRQLGASVLGRRVALGGRFAAEHFGLQHATTGRRTIWVEADVERALAAMELVEAEPGRGQVWVGRPRQIESCFRARVMSEDGLAFVDPCQLMLETSTDPTRGYEQSEFILQRIIDWQEGSDEGDE